MSRICAPPKRSGLKNSSSGRRADLLACRIGTTFLGVYRAGPRPSVYLKRQTWYLRVNDSAGRWVCLASGATTKTEARRLAEELERKAERVRMGLEAAPSPAGAARWAGC
jgi:hypothetical protein